MGRPGARRIYNRPHGLGKYAKERCRCDVCRAAKSKYRLTRIAARRRPAPPVLLTWEDLGVRRFGVQRCAWCGGMCCDQQGRPRWEIVGQLTFVCQGCAL